GTGQRERPRRAPASKGPKNPGEEGTATASAITDWRNTAPAKWTTTMSNALSASRKEVARNVHCAAARPRETRNNRVWRRTTRPEEKDRRVSTNGCRNRARRSRAMRLTAPAARRGLATANPRATDAATATTAATRAAPATCGAAGKPGEAIAAKS